ncbi:MAG: alpha/beta hydrolase [Patescibacteria group bacterium]
MKTIILPGFSAHNKEWTDDLKKNLKLSHQIEIIDWEHWKSGGGLKLKKEMEKIDRIVEKDKFNIIAKSVGTMVALRAIDKYKKQVNKVILCGIPSISDKRMDIFKSLIKDFDHNNIICFQNSFDPFVSFKDLKSKIHKINSKITVSEKSAKNHDYYYFEDFQKFLLS